MQAGDAEETADAIEGWPCALLIVIAVVLHTVALLNVKPLQSANDRSRWCTVWSLVERRTFQIDEIRRERGWDSIDIIYDGEHFYSTKPPLLSVVVAGVTWCVQRLTGWTLLGNTQPLTGVVLCLVNIIPFAISLILLARLLRRLAISGFSRMFVLGVAGFGTLVTPFLMTLNNHTVAVAGVIVGLYALEQIVSQEVPSGATFALCGFASAWAAANELPAAAFGVATFAICLMKSPRVTLCCYVPAALIPSAAFLATNFAATGGLTPTYANYGSSKYNYVIDGVPSYWMEPHGVDQNLDSPLLYFIHCTIGHHGILSLTPVLLLTIAGWAMTGALRQPFLKIVSWLGMILTAVTLAFYLSRTQNYNFGGVSCALRWAIWLIPLWLLALIPVVDQGARSRAFRTFALMLFAGSAISAWLPIESPWQQPWLFRQMEARGWIDYSDKPPPPLPRSLWTWFASIPEATDETWVEFTSALADGAQARLRMQSRSHNGSNQMMAIEVQEAKQTQELSTTRTFLIDRQQFEAGASAADFMDWSDPNIGDQQRESDMTFVRGLPLKREYRAGKLVYLKTPLRRNAFHCQYAAAAVDTEGADGRILRYRCDLWLCREIPFGVAQVEYQITDPVTKTTRRQEIWTVSRCNPAISE